MHCGLSCFKSACFENKDVRLTFRCRKDEGVGESFSNRECVRFKSVLSYVAMHCDDNS